MFNKGVKMKFKTKALGKIVGLLVVLVLLLMGLGQITDLVRERQETRREAVASVAQSLAGSQTLLGPLVHQTCTEEWVEGRGKEATTQRRTFERIAVPSSLEVNGNSALESRARGIHATQLFTLKAQISAQWNDLKTLDAADSDRSLHAGAKLSCAVPNLMLAVTDARGIRQAEIKVNGVAQTVVAGTMHPAYPRGVMAALPEKTEAGVPLTANIELELIGTESLHIVPLGNSAQIKLTSNWPHPSFYGQFLPAERKITEHGFEAAWRVSSLASTVRQAVANQGSLCSRSGLRSRYQPDRAAEVADAAVTVAASAATANGPCIETVAVAFVDPINTYSLSDRATKYGLLFIALTFVAVGLFEFMRNLRVHPVQYFLVGAAISIFFLLLVSLAEHLSFHLAYAIAASACVLLLTYYASHMLQSWRRGLPFGTGIALLYGMLYVLLQLEQTALVVGATALFTVLAVVMWLTRNVDWYARLQADADAPVSAEAAPQAPAHD
jgi:inner membrane protein